MSANAARPSGGGGGGSAVSSAQADENLLAGQVIYVKGTSNVELAQANTRPDTEAAGLVLSDTLTGFTAPYVTQGTITLSDWTNVIGAAALAPGVRYFLSAATAGRLVSAQVSGGNFHVFVGRALSTTTLDVDIDPPILIV